MQPDQHAVSLRERLEQLERFDPEHDESHRAEYQHGNAAIVMEPWEEGNWLRRSDVLGVLDTLTQQEVGDGLGAGLDGRGNPSCVSVDSEDAGAVLWGCERCNAMFDQNPDDDDSLHGDWPVGCGPCGKEMTSIGLAAELLRNPSPSKSTKGERR